MRNPWFVALAFVFITTTPIADDSSGRVTDDNEKGVASATVVLVEKDLIVTTDENGDFTFTDLDEGTYTVLILAPGFPEWEGNVDFTQDAPTVELKPDVIEMDAITVVGKAVVPEEILDNEVDSEELERLPARSDPFEAVTQESGILKDVSAGIFGGGFAGGGSGFNGGPETTDGSGTSVSLSVEIGEIGRLNRGRGSRVSVYGGESDWNNYYYDYFRMPTNTHSFGYPVPGAIVPVEAVDEIGIYKGVIPVEYGPAIGGLFTLEPAQAAQEFSLIVTPSIMDVGVLTRWNIAENLSLLVSANQSIVQYTVLPLIYLLSPIGSEDEVSEEGDPTSFMYGDALFRLVYTPPQHSISLDIIAYYDAWLFDLSFGNFSLYSKYGPYYIAVGSNWKYSPSASITNSLYVYGSYYSDFGLSDFEFPSVFSFGEEEFEPEAFTDLHIDWLSNVSSLQAGDELFWYLTSSSSLVFGVNGRLADLTGTYIENIVQTDTTGVELSNDTLDLEGVDELLLSGYGYAKYFGLSEPFTYNCGVGLLWYPSESVFRPSLNAEALFASDGIVAAVGAGWSPGVIDEFSYIDRRLDEQYYELESVTNLDQPPMAVSAAAQLVYTFSDKHNVGLSPYFAWYYDLSGIAVSTSGTDIGGGFISYDPQKGYSTGIDISWKARLSERFDLSLSYAFAWTRYLTEEWGWVAPNTEVRHALKSGLLFKSGGLKLGQNLLVYSGIPFTPDEVTKNDMDEVEITRGDYNSAIDYVPYFDIRTNVTYTWNFKRFDLALFFNSSNWLSVANATLQGIDPNKQDIVGTTSAKYADREYYYSTDILRDLLISLLLSELGFSVTM